MYLRGDLSVEYGIMRGIILERSSEAAHPFLLSCADGAEIGVRILPCIMNCK